MARAVTSRRSDSTFGKRDATRVLRLFFSVQSLDSIGGPQSATMGYGDLEHGETLREVVSHPLSQPRLRRFVGGDRFCDQAVGVGFCSGGVDAADALSDFAPGSDLGHVVPGVLLQVKLAPLPSRSWEGCVDRSIEPGVAVACDQDDSAKAASLKRLQETAPMHFGLGGRRSDSQDLCADRLHGPVWPEYFFR